MAASMITAPLAELLDGTTAFFAGAAHVITHGSVLLTCLKRMPLLALCVVATASVLWAALPVEILQNTISDRAQHGSDPHSR